MKLKITVHGVAYEVDVEVLDPGDGFPAPISPSRTKPRSGRNNHADSVATIPQPDRSAAAPVSGSDGGSVASPIAGTVIEIKCKPGDKVTKGQILLVIEAMKMKTSIAAPAEGVVKAIPVAAGDSVRESQVLVEFE